MKRLAILAFMAALSGCGQNIDGIKANYIDITDDRSDVSFDGYVAVVSKDASRQIETYIKENRLSKHVLNSPGNLEFEIKDVDFDKGEYRVVKDSWNAYLQVKETVKEKAKQEVEKDIQERTAKAESMKLEVAELQEKLAAYKSHIASAENDLKQSKSLMEKSQKDKKAKVSAMYDELKSVVIANDIPLKLGKSYNIAKLYRIKSCERVNEKSFAFHPLNDGNGKCATIRKRNYHETVLPLLVKHGAAYEAFVDQERGLKKDIKAAEKNLKNAKIIASNKTGIDLENLKKKIKKNTLAQKLARVDGREDQLLEAKLLELSLNNKDLISAKNEFELAVDIYNEALMREAVRKSDIEIFKFSDEHEKPLDGQKGVAFVFYSFLSDKNKQNVYMAIERNPNRTYKESFIRKPKLLPNVSLQNLEDVGTQLVNLIKEFG